MKINVAQILFGHRVFTLKDIALENVTNKCISPSCLQVGSSV